MIDALFNPEHPFQRHDLVDEDGDGVFDYGTYPYRPKGTNISMSRKVYRNEDADFFVLERIVNASLAASGTHLRVINEHF